MLLCQAGQEIIIFEIKDLLDRELDTVQFDCCRLWQASKKQTYNKPATYYQTLLHSHSPPLSLSQWFLISAIVGTAPYFQTLMSVPIVSKGPTSISIHAWCQTV